MSTRWYLDTSAALKLVVDEVESSALALALDETPAALVSTWLLETEMRRAAHRIPGLTQSLVSEVLSGVGLHEVSASLLREAGLLPGVHLRSLDAVHLAAAIRLGVEQVVTYDVRMAAAATDLGLGVLAPSPEGSPEG